MVHLELLKVLVDSNSKPMVGGVSIIISNNRSVFIVMKISIFFFFKNLRKYFFFLVMQLRRRWLSQSEELTGTQLGPRDGVYGIHNYNTTRLQDISSSVVWMVKYEIQSIQRNAASTTSTTTIAYNCNIQAMQSIFSTMPSTINLRSILQMSTY